MAQSIPELYGSLVFNDKIMREKLPKDMYKALKKTIENGTHLELDVANSVAVAMKEWALEHGATLTEFQHTGQLHISAFSLYKSIPVPKKSYGFSKFSSNIHIRSYLQQKNMVRK